MADDSTRVAAAHRRHNPTRSGGIFMILTGVIVACVFLGTGISNVGHAAELSREGTTVRATVLQNHGWGRSAIRVGYVTSSGKQEGTLDTHRESTAYPLGSQVTVVYDRASPSVVTLPGEGAGGGWWEIGVGSTVLLLFGGLGLGSLVRRQRGAGLTAQARN